MASLSSGRPAAVAILVLLNVLAWTDAQIPELEMLPPGNIHSKPIGSQWLLTCKPVVSDPELVSNLQWLDPLDRVIESQSQSSYNDPGVPDISTTIQPNGGISLVFSTFKEHHAGNYTCVGTYANTETMKRTVKIETTDGITFLDAPENQYAILGKEFKIKCQVSARPAPTVTWLHGKENVVTNDHYVIETHALKIKKVEMSDEGTYSCVASVLQTGEYQPRLIRVEVHELPKIEELPAEIEITEGRTETIECKASGKPPPKYSWINTLNSKNLSITDRFGVDADTGFLTITNVQKDDSGEYQCIAKNAAGQVNSNTYLNVITKPKIMEFLNRTTEVGKTIEITCKAFGRPAPEVLFRKQTAASPFTKGIQANDDRISLTSIPNKATGETVATLTIQNVLRDDDGVYECIAENKVSPTYMNGHLTVQFPPSFASMTNETVWSWAQRRTVNLTCTAESIPNATIRWTKGDIPLDMTQAIYTEIGKGPISTLTITPKDQRDFGFYKCHATNPLGEATNIIELRQAEKPSTIPQARMSEITATTIVFNIVPPPSQAELPIRTITVEYKETNQPWSLANNRTWSLNSLYVLENLKPQTSYEFRFRATNDVGDSNWGANIVETTPVRTFPNPPKMQTRTQNPEYDMSLYSNQYEINWIAPPDNGEPIDQYDVRYCEVKRISGEWQVQDSTCKIEIVKGQRSKQWIRELSADTYYQVDVRAHNAIGYGNPATIKFRTARATTTPVLHQGPLISSAAIIGIVIAILFLLIVVIDVICCCAYKSGIIYYICERSRRKPVDEDDAKLGREEKEPLKEEKKITPIIDSGLRRETSITFDGKRSISKTGFVGKDSAV